MGVDSAPVSALTARKKKAGGPNLRLSFYPLWIFLLHRISHNLVEKLLKAH